MTKKTADECEFVTPLEPVQTWEEAADLARSALVFVISDPRESGAVRVKAAELLLEYARPKPREGQPADGPVMGIEEWLFSQGRESGL